MKFKIKNFKCFYDTSVNINNLTILAGANGFGKSSVIQALLFLRRTIEHCSKWNGSNYTEELDYRLNVELNGPYGLSLGMSNDVIPIDSERDSILDLKLENDNNSFNVKYKLSDETNMIWLNLLESKLVGELKYLSIFNKEFFYLNAERIGPRVSQCIKSHDYPNVGWKGEYTAQILAEYGYKNELNTQIEVDKERLFNVKDTNRYLLKQAQEWMSFVIPDTIIDSKIDFLMQCAQIIVNNKYSKSNKVLSTNIGFGISYLLPIIVTGLIAPKGSIMIVENPEAHLHPSAQSKVGYFLSVVAQSGVKVIVETHSEHLINGIQIAVAKEMIHSEIITINFFSNKNNEKQCQQPFIQPISITTKGKLTSWPVGFFDQTQIDYSILYKISTND